MTDWLTIGLSLLGWIVLPGLGLATLGASRRRGPFFARASAFGLGTWILGSQTLERTVGISTGWSWGLCIVLGLAGAAGLLIPRHRHVVDTLGRPLVTGLAVLFVLLFAWLPTFAVSLDRPDVLIQPTPWYYWHNAVTVAEEGRAPESTHEWGTTTTFLSDYPGFTAATATLIAQVPGAGRRPAQAVMAVAFASAMIGLGAVCSSFGAGRATIVVAGLLLLSLAVFATKFSSYRPEAMGYGLALLSAAMAIRWLMDRDVAALLAGGTAFVTLGQVHGIVFTLSAAFIGGAIASSADRIWGERLRGLGRVALLVSGWGVAWAIWTPLMNGTLSGVEQVGDLDRISGSDDPTWAFFRAVTRIGEVDPPTNATLAHNALESGLVRFELAGLGLLTAVTLAVVIVRCLSGPVHNRVQARRYLAFAVSTVLGMLAVSLWFGIAWDTYVPRRTGFGRLLQLVPILLPIGVAVATNGSRRFHRTALGVSAIVVVLLTSFTWRWLPDTFRDQRPTRDEWAALQQIELPEDALVLANTYTEGFIPEALGAQGLLDGRAPYTYPDLLDRATELSNDAVAFLADPRSDPEFLSRHGVTHVVVANRHSWALGSPVRNSVDETALRTLPSVSVVSVDGPVRLYAVAPPNR